MILGPLNPNSWASLLTHNFEIKENNLFLIVNDHDSLYTPRLIPKVMNG